MDWLWPSWLTMTLMIWPRPSWDDHDLMNWPILVGHDPYELTMAHMSWPRPSWTDHDSSDLTIALMIWPQPLSDLDAILEGCYHFIMIVLITTAVVNVPQLWSSVESSNLHKFVQFPTLSLNWVVVFLKYKTSVQTWVLLRTYMQNDTKIHIKYHSKSGLSSSLCHPPQLHSRRNSDSIWS